MRKGGGRMERRGRHEEGWGEGGRPLVVFFTGPLPFRCGWLAWQLLSLQV